MRIVYTYIQVLLVQPLKTIRNTLIFVVLFAQPLRTIALSCFLPNICIYNIYIYIQYIMYMYIQLVLQWIVLSEQE